MIFSDDLLLIYTEKQHSVFVGEHPCFYFNKQAAFVSPLSVLGSCVRLPQVSVVLETGPVKVYWFVTAYIVH